MKFLMLVAVVIAAEAWMMWLLIGSYGFSQVALIYFIFTIICLLLVALIKKRVLPDREIKKKRIRNIREKIKKNIALTASETESFEVLTIIGIFQMAYFFILIPGLITDSLGLLLVVPRITWKITNYLISVNQKKAIEKA